MNSLIVLKTDFTSDDYMKQAWEVEDSITRDFSSVTITSSKDSLRQAQAAANKIASQIKGQKLTISLPNVSVLFEGEEKDLALDAGELFRQDGIECEAFLAVCENGIQTLRVTN